MKVYFVNPLPVDEGRLYVGETSFNRTRLKHHTSQYPLQCWSLLPFDWILVQVTQKVSFLLTVWDPCPHIQELWLTLIFTKIKECLESQGTLWLLFCVHKGTRAVKDNLLNRYLGMKGRQLKANSLHHDLRWHTCRFFLFDGNWFQTSSFS